MKKFEYQKAFIFESCFSEIHNQYGAEGWEIIAIDFKEKFCYMKREIPVEYEYKESRSFEYMLKEGWEPIGICLTKMSTTYYLFKRPKP